jgi:hypothetical protein
MRDATKFVRKIDMRKIGLSARRSVAPLLTTLVLVLTLFLVSVPTLALADDSQSLLGIVPADWIQTTSRVLPNGDATDVYYPRVPRHLQQKYEKAFPVIAFLQGALVDKSEYSNFGKLLARHGFVVFIPNHYQNIPPYGLALFTSENVVNQVLAQAKQENNNPQSPLHNIINTHKMGLVGHSLGGAVGLYAEDSRNLCIQSLCTDTYTRPPELLAGAFYGTNLSDSTGQTFDVNTTGIATALVQGTLDGRALPQKAEITYPLLETPRGYITVKGANHFGMCNDNAPVGAIPDSIAPTLSQSAENHYIAQWTGLWLRAQLNHDPIAKAWIYYIRHSADGVVQVKTN